jgi:indolepyruvate ferredoxin oxidoreductase beta subunit
MSKVQKPVTVLIAAMGGEGGGVLTAWIVSAARKAGLPVQATSIPGVAQRTGATTYYVEIVPTPYSALGGAEPVLDLYPGPGDLDVVVATELIEAGRVVEKGFVSPERTLLIASSHRVYALPEKMAMGDGRYDGERVEAAARQMAKRLLMFDMERAAQDSGSVVNAVILGTLCGAGALPMAREFLEASIRDEGKAVKSNLAGFEAGIGYAKGDIVEMKPKRPAAASSPTAAPAPAVPPAEDAGAAALRARIERDYPPVLRPLVLEAAGRCLDYQDAKYAALYLDRLDTIHALDRARGDGDTSLTFETGRHLGLRMTFEDVIRVAQLKSRASRFERVRRDVQAAPEQMVKVTEFLKPGLEEFASLLPPFIARPALRWAGRKPARLAKTHVGLYVRTDTISGFLKVRAMAGMRRLRRMGHRYVEEQKQIEAWLGLVRAAAGFDRRYALEVVELARLVKGYGSTHKRGLGNFDRIAAALVAPAIAAGRGDGALLKRAREAALADPEGAALGKLLGEAAAAPKLAAE